MKTIRSGFTLLELMIGLIISIILASIAIPSFSKAIEKTKVKDAQSTLAAIFSAEKIYRLDQGSYGTCCGTASNLVANNYIANPTAGNTTWAFSVLAEDVTDTTFKATATRTQAGGRYNDQTITVTGTFNGTNYGGTHELRDK